MTIARRASPADADWLSDVEAAQVVDSADDVAWDDQTELLVVGYGGAGVAAALEARKAGVDVLALDRFAGGGSTAINGGIFYAGGGTRIQQAAGQPDSVEDMHRYLAIETEGVVRETTLRRFCESSADNLDWLMRRGVKFDGRLFTKKWGYPDPRYFLYYSDNSLAPSRARAARPAPRGHRVHATFLANGQYGQFIYGPLARAAARAGVRFMPHAEVRQLITGKDGTVLGAKALIVAPNTPAWARRREHQIKAARWQTMLPMGFPGAAWTWRIAARHRHKAETIERAHRVERRIRATAGVCLATGGFIHNRAMVRHYAPHHAETAPMGNPGDDGSGIRLGQSAGGAVERLGRIGSWRFLNPPGDWVRGMIVNRRGERFVDESLYSASIGHALNEEQGGVAHLIFDRVIARRAWRELLTVRMMRYQRYPGLLAMMKSVKAATVESLAMRIGIDPAALRRSVDAYNRAAAGLERDAHEKDQDEMQPLVEGPFYAIDISAANRVLPMMAMTLGGLAVDEDSGQVLSDRGAPVSGLFACGRAAVGVCSNVYMSGLSLADCIFSGRRVGRHVAGQRGASVHAASRQPPPRGAGSHRIAALSQGDIR